MEFGLKKCGVVILKKGRLVKFDRIHLPNQEIMKEVYENGYTYLGILELDEIKEHKIKNKVTAEYKRSTMLILKSKFNGKNKIQAINTWAVALLRYGVGIINWIVDKLNNEKGFGDVWDPHPKSDINQLYLKQKHGVRGLISIEPCVRSEENNLSLVCTCVNQRRKKVGIVKIENLMEKEEFKKNSQNEFKNKWHEKIMHGGKGEIMRHHQCCCTR